MDELKNNSENLEVPIGKLFDSINYYKLEDLEKFFSELSHEQAMYCIIQACQSAFNRNSYTLLESELLSKAIRKISYTNISEKEE